MNEQKTYMISFVEKNSNNAPCYVTASQEIGYTGISYYTDDVNKAMHFTDVDEVTALANFFQIRFKNKYIISIKVSRTIIEDFDYSEA